MTMNAKQLVHQRLGLGPDRALDTSNIGLSRGETVAPSKADPLGMLATAEIVRTIQRPDEATLAVPNGYYGDTGGNQVADLGAISTRKRLDYSKRSASAPLGASLPDGFYV